MKRGLVVVTPTDRSRELVREAGAFAEGVGAKLILLAVTPEDEYEETQSAVADIGSDDVVYGLEQAEESAERLARRVANETLGDLDVEYEIVGAVGREARRILGVAEERDCDHLFIAGRRRSPTGKALFGDLTQRILLNFDGHVTVSLGDDE
jgi:nucleotide-binding universal stress UspA family protein